MNSASDIGIDIRQSGRDALAEALQASRRDTLRTFERYAAGLATLSVPMQATLNPPLWELGHIGWFQDHWIARNPERAHGAAADPDAPRGPCLPANGDALYNSSRVPHDSRWQLPLPDAAATRADLARQLDRTLALLADPRATDDSDAGLYFFRLALLHEDMHHEAALYMAQSLGLPLGDGTPQPPRLGEANPPLDFDAGAWRLGHAGPGFAFDNELGAHEVAVPAGRIDARVLRWAEYLPFVEAGGYASAHWWSDAGRAWLAQQDASAPRYLRRQGKASGTWQKWRDGHWLALDLAQPACHLSAFEAEAWCRWAGRRLPTEAEWERAAISQPEAFHWGAVWEWTASDFAPYPGFTPHPYVDYSAPWFGSRRVLRGGSFGTQARMHHPRYRNFFPPERNDVFAGFRSCAA